ncbi:Mg-chelatase subunit ChlD [Thermoanaerobacterium thermosaccharolyticum M0795]|uniref:Mg-chelatase subunit ChlD n=2 Tax=Thermoanaerobacterium thermosaccharolyticum TaxID=1517 RepID=L0IGR9_THETR|nr:Mg-chelatase subunit ChlD [Thermoanaerobacterium thermosaccharolyticum M0795]
MFEMSIRQIIVVTDGKSNVGGNPADAAYLANKKGITVSAIGIVDDGILSHKEIKDIANWGGGVYDIIYSDEFIKSLSAITQKSAEKTIYKTLDSELMRLIGKNIEGLHPVLRSQIIDYIDKLLDVSNLKCAILLDLSGSMKNKLKKAVNGITDLLSTFRARRGKSELCLIGFPGENNVYAKILCPFTARISDIEFCLDDVKAGGNTPTYYAIEMAASLFENEINTMRYIV